ncbi:MAG: biopolymer transporter ExbD [Elusimicrobia bacterium]|nr:biopolymer transporter ExbD [Elusimicrobiota bacterium]
MQSGPQEELVTGINVTPLVDVGLVLVIIFMVTAPLFELPSLPVNLPKTHTKEGKEKENITVTITREGKLAVNEEEVSSNNLKSVLEKRLNLSAEKHLILRADKESLHGELLLVMHLAKELGAKSMAIATEPLSN